MQQLHVQIDYNPKFAEVNKKLDEILRKIGDVNSLKKKFKGRTS